MGGTATRTDREGYVYQDGILIGRVVKYSSGRWHAFVQLPGRVSMMRAGKFTTKREAVAETIIMREV